MLSGCVREDIVKIEPKPESDRLVVFGLLTPAEYVYIQVGKSQSFGSGKYDSDKFNVKRAVVTITSGAGKKVNLLPVKNRLGLYSISQAEFPIRPGDTYHIKVEAPSLETITATTTVPSQKAVWKKLALFITDPDPYYGSMEILGSWNAVESGLGIGYGVTLLLPSAETKILQYSNEGISPRGEEYTLKREISFSNDTQLDAVLITRDRYYNEFSKVSELTTEVLNYYHNAVFADIISGFKGVIPRGGNIENGLGVFGSYLTDTRTLYKN